ncbi:MAG TPA: NAD(P)/FAD-dependent oxidoreductase [Solirubrobacteraceae bacterium]|jgi:cation diffusion facilitator CzcD-associated flavoprotein CzcO
MAGSDTPDHDVAVIGAGFSGIGTAILLDRAGFSDYLVVEEGEGVGGAWHWNTYPGIAVDIPSFSYQFSFETRADWSRVYAPGAELKAYADHCVDKYRIRDRIRFGTRVTGATFDERGDTWRIGTAGGDKITARHVINASGPLSQPKFPELDGLGDFAGITMHSSRWDHTVDLKGRRVGIIGTGASAVQVIPAIATEVEKLTVFQRTPIWCLPKPDRPLGGRERWVLENIPGVRLGARLLSQVFVELNFPLAAHFYGIVPLANRGEAIARAFLEKEVHDPVVRDKLTPRYGLGCKRPSFHNEYLAAFNRQNVELETAPIERATPEGIRTSAAEHELDILILATGFRILEPIFPIHGVGGVELDAWWDENRMQAYEGISVPGFPNFFHIVGPYGFNGSSFFLLIETQMRHINRCLKRARERGSTRVEVTPEANDRYWKQMLDRRHNQIFFRGTCDTANSYYFDRHGDVPFRASPSLEAMWRSARFSLDDYSFA